MMATLTVGKLVLTNTPSNNDAFDRLRVSQPVTLLDVNHTFDRNPLIIDERTIGTGAITGPANAAVLMTVSANSDVAIRQSKEYVPYQPGKSRLMLFTGVLNTSANALVTSRIGCFDDKEGGTIPTAFGDGHYFQLIGTTLSVVERSSTLGTTTIVSQGSWNIDNFDGTGPSRLTISASDLTKALLFVIDQEWLGVGDVRFGLAFQNTIWYCHRFEHNAVEGGTGITVPYTISAKLPVRYEISSQGGAGEMRMICTTVISEGGYIPLGRRFATATPTDVSVSSTLIPIMSLRLRGDLNYSRITAKITTINVVNTGGGTARYALILNPTLTGASFANFNTSTSGVQIDTSATALSGGISLYSDYVSTKSTTQIVFSPEDIISQLGVNTSITGTSDVMTLAAIALSGTQTISGSLNWVEII